MGKKSSISKQLELVKIPACIKLVEESEIDAQNLDERLGHKLFYQNAIRGVVA